MADHYYSAKPVSGHEKHEFETVLRGISLKLATDAGVFSKNRVDPGTKLLIESLRLSPAPAKILDLGCGYGPIGLVLAKLLPGAKIFMADINERAVDLARENARLNGIDNVDIRVGEGFHPVLGEEFDLIVTNPPIRAGKQVIYPLVDDSISFLKKDGWFVAVIMTKQGAKSLEKKMEEVYGNVGEWEKGSGYRVIASQRL